MEKYIVSLSKLIILYKYAHFFNFRFGSPNSIFCVQSFPLPFAKRSLSKGLHAGKTHFKPVFLDVLYRDNYKLFFELIHRLTQFF